MTGASPAWEDDAGLIAWIEENADALPTRKGDQHERRVARLLEEASRMGVEEEDRQFEALDTAMRAEEAARLTLTAEEKSALLAAFESSADDRLDALCAVLRAGRPSPGFLAVLAEMIALRLLHGPARKPFGTRAPLPSGIALRFQRHDYAASLTLLFGGAHTASDYHVKALRLLEAKYVALGWPRGTVERRISNANEKTLEERRAGYALWRRVQRATPDDKY